jgi:hypothetical protein
MLPCQLEGSLGTAVEDDDVREGAKNILEVARHCVKMEQDVDMKITIELLGRLAVLVCRSFCPPSPVHPLISDSALFTLTHPVSTSGPKSTRSWPCSVVPTSMRLPSSSPRQSCLVLLHSLQCSYSSVQRNQHLLDEDRRIYGNFLMSDVARKVVGMEEVDGAIVQVPTPVSG